MQTGYNKGGPKIGQNSKINNEKRNKLKAEEWGV